MTATWHERALCAKHPDPDLWFRNGEGSTAEAVEVCLECPVQRECLADAIKADVTDGIWAAVTPGLIAAIANRRGAGRLTADMDELAVQAACRGAMPGGRGYLTPAERAEAVRRLHAKGMTDAQVAKHLQIGRHTAAQVRYRLRLPPNTTT